VRGLAFVVLLASCGGSPDPVAQPTPTSCGPLEIAKTGCVRVGVETCASGFRADDRGGCVAILPGACPEGSLAVPGDSACVPIGARTCPSGLVANGRGACDAVLPEASCGADEIATPGDTSCRLIAECGGELPTDAPILHVDQAFTGTSDGTRASPFRTIQAAIDRAADTTRTTIAIAKGTYVENLDVGKPVRLYGACPAEVTIRAVDGVKAPTIRIRADAEVHRVSLTAPATGASSVVQVADADAVIERVSIHDANAIGLRVQYATKATKLRARDVKIERVLAIGAWVVGGTLDAERVVIRDVAAAEEHGRAIEVASNAAVGKLSLRSALIERVHDIGILVAGAEGDVSATVVRDIAGSKKFLVGHAIEAALDDAGKPATMTLDGVVLERAHDAALFVSGSRVTASRLTIRDSRGLSDTLNGPGRGVAVQAAGTKPLLGELTLRASRIEATDDDGVFVAGGNATLDEVLVLNSGRLGSGRGIAARVSENGNTPSTVSLRRVLVAGSDGAGILGTGSTMTIEASEVRDVRPTKTNEGDGFCVVAQRVAGTGPASLSLTNSNIGPCTGAGVVVYGSSGVIRTSFIHDISARAFAPGYGRGIEVGYADSTAAPGELSLFDSVVSGATEVGVLIAGSNARIERSVIRDTRPATAEAVYAAGVVVQLASVPGTLNLRQSLIDGARAVGVYSIGSSAIVERALIRDVKAAPGSLFGDGLSATGGKLDVRETLVREVDRAGISLFGSALSLSDSRLACVAIDLNSEPWRNAAPTLNDAGGNVCGCTAPAKCRAQSARLVPIPELAK
jgi:hypothetical protein